jgi:uncharacterized phage protein gp47/JayE
LSYGYNDDGFTRKDITDIIEEKEEEARDIFDTVNHSISDPLWQWLKIVCQERFAIENMNELASYMMSIEDAVGAFLDKHGIECGMERKGATKAQGYVEITLTLSGVPITIASGTRFAGGLNTYISDEDTTAPLTLTMTKSKTGVSYDYFPTYIDSITEEGIAQIKLSTGDIVNPSYYSVDPIYLNNIIWEEDSDAFLVEGEMYTVTFTGQMVLKIEVSSEDTGSTTNAIAGTITSCLDYPGYSVSNSEGIEGGLDQEEDDDYRERLLGARRRTFTLGSVKDIVLGIEGVRACKVYQSVGVDQSSCDDWDNKFTGQILTVTGQRPLYSQTFVPGEQIATLGRVTLYGRPYNFPPALYIGIKRDISSYATGYYFDYAKIERTELDPSLTGFKDIPINIKYNDLDKTKTYRLDVWCDVPNIETFDWNENYWLLATTTGYRSDVRGTLSSIDNATGYSDMGIDLVFKTHFNGAGFNVVVACEDGYGFNNIELDIEEKLDYIDGGGYSPICIQPYIVEADEILIDVRATIYVSELADFDMVRTEIETYLETYLENLDVGEDVYYAKIHQTIMSHPQVTNLKELYIKRRDMETYDVLDLPILDDEIPDLGTTSIQHG